MRDLTPVDNAAQISAMRKLIMWNLVTLDGFFEGRNKWDIAWHNIVWGDELEALGLAQGEAADALVFGRVTYEGMAKYWATAEGAVADFMNARTKYVFSRTLASADWNNATVVKEDAAAAMTRLKQQPGKDMYIFGSANLSATFTRHGLIDEYRLCVVPVVLDEGTRLFADNPSGMQLKLIDSRQLKTGGVILRYTR